MIAAEAKHATVSDTTAILNITDWVDKSKATSLEKDDHSHQNSKKPVTPAMSSKRNPEPNTSGTDHADRHKYAFGLDEISLRHSDRAADCPTYAKDDQRDRESTILEYARLIPKRRPAVQICIIHRITSVTIFGETLIK